MEPIMKRGVRFGLNLGMLLAAMALPASAITVMSLTGTLPGANSEYTFEFQVTGSINLTAQSYGYGGTANAPHYLSNPVGTNFAGQVIDPGGFDSYLTLFSGLGPTAVFTGQSNDDGPCPFATADGGNCFDARLNTSLTTGTYTLVLSASNNFSIAENYGSGTLGDGFIGLESSDFSSLSDPNGRTANWALDLSTNSDSRGTFASLASPEPAGWTLAGAGLLLVLAGRRARKQQEGKSIRGNNI
jgi:hypothetical protein